MTLKNLLRTKNIEALQAEAGGRVSFAACLGFGNSPRSGSGADRVGIFVLTGVVAATQAGPAVSLSFVIAGVASAAAALCYAEFSSMIPVAAAPTLMPMLCSASSWPGSSAGPPARIRSCRGRGFDRLVWICGGLAGAIWRSTANMGARSARRRGRLCHRSCRSDGRARVAGLLTLRIEWGARFNTTMVILKTRRFCW